MTVGHRIIDGQQRLMSITLVLAAVRHKLSSLPETDIRRSEVSALDGLLLNVGSKPADQIKVVPYGDDRDAYVQILVTGLSSTPGDRVSRAYDFFKTKVDRLKEADLIRLRDAMAARLYFAAVYLNETDDAHKIFRSLNEAGLSLSPTDHIRNNLFMSAGKAGDSLFVDYWEPLEKGLKTPNTLLAFLFAEQARKAHEPKTVVKRDLHHSYSRHFDRLFNKPRKTREYLTDLSTNANVYAAMKGFVAFGDAGLKPTQDMLTALERLNAWGSQPAEIWVLDVLARNRGQGT